MKNGRFRTECKCQECSSHSCGPDCRHWDPLIFLHLGKQFSHSREGNNKPETILSASLDTLQKTLPGKGRIDRNGFLRRTPQAYTQMKRERGLNLMLM